MFVNKITTERKSLEITGATLLSVEEAKKLDSACLKVFGACDAWWLRSHGFYAYNAACVFGEYGIVTSDGDGVGEELGVRPALIISNLGDFEVGDKFEVGEYAFTIISDDYALCDDIIGSSPFREDYEADDANDYEASDIKKYVDDWFLNHIH